MRLVHYLVAVVGAATFTVGSEVGLKVPGMPNTELFDFATDSFTDGPTPAPHPLPGLLYPRESESREV